MLKKISAVLLAFILIFSCVSVAFAAGDETEILPGRDFPHGDANLDTRVSIKDVTIIRKHLAYIVKLSDPQLKLADVDGSMGVTVKDATYIQKFIAGLVDSLINAEQATTAAIAETTIGVSETMVHSSSAETTQQTSENNQVTSEVLATDATEPATEEPSTVLVTDATEAATESVITTEITEATEATAPTRDPNKPVELPFVPAK